MVIFNDITQHNLNHLTTSIMDLFLNTRSLNVGDSLENTEA